MEPKFKIGQKVVVVDVEGSCATGISNGDILTVEGLWQDPGGSFGYDFKESGYVLREHRIGAYQEKKTAEDIGSAATSKPIKSDGGSSDYYKIPVKLPQELYDASGNLVTEVTFETQDLLYAMFYGEWSCSNVGKAARRIAEALQGRGKEGTSIAYDAKKIIWFGEDILNRFGKEE